MPSATERFSSETMRPMAARTTAKEAPERPRPTSTPPERCIMAGVEATDIR